MYIDWGTKIIYIMKTDLSLVQSTPTEIYNLNLNTFRLALKDLEDSEEGIPYPSTHNHNSEVVLSGITFARVIEIINGYSITFQNGQYAVNLIGANSNVADVVNVNQVSVRVSNSAGLITVTSGSGVTQQDKLDIILGVWEELLSEHKKVGTAGKKLYDLVSGSGSTTQKPTLTIGKINIPL